MKLGIMQPYLFPWIGYFQLIHHVDELVVYDDVQYIKGGWINRNRIVVNGRPCYITLPVLNQSHKLPICARRFAPSFERDKRRILKSIETAYAAAPYFRETLSLVQDCFAYTDDNVAVFVTKTLEKTCAALNIDTPLQRSSAMELSRDVGGQDRVIDICKSRAATDYVNAIGGVDLYDAGTFSQHGIRLHFLRPRDVIYRQSADEFVPRLSIIDVLMFNDRHKIAELLAAYDFETPRTR